MISAGAVTTRHELIMSLVAGLNPIMKVWKRTQLNNEDLCQMVLMTSKTSLQKWSGVFLFPSVSPAFFQIVQLSINTACVSAGVDSCMNSCR